jgi:asparagine synthase (glutamine-hydrolysing)
MCGLAGLFRADGGAVDTNLLRRMTAALAHRGPDGDGLHVEPGIGLGHRRLAIVDLQGGRQPMFNEDGSVAIVFNGQIYNYPELWPELQALGHRFRSDHSDTEVIIHAWESWGSACLSRLSGMFAFAIWDRNRGSLFLARDHLGKKPLYYGTDRTGCFVFASELRALAEVAELPRRIDPAAVDDFFAYGYVPDPNSIFRDIYKLPPAHFLLLDSEGGRLLDRNGGGPAPQRYWRPSAEALAIDAETATGALIGHLQAATKQRLMADVPLGAFLSGGVDSSAVVAMAARARATALDTFTIGFEAEQDETPYAMMVAQRYATTQHTARAAAVDMIDAARRQGGTFGEPFGDASAVPTHAVCALARQYATVALSGDGGDEVFLGYRRYQWHRLVEAARAMLPAGLRRHAIGTLARVYPKLDRAPRWLRAKHTLTELSLSSALGYYNTVARVHDAQRSAMFSPAQRAALDGHDPAARIATLMAESGTDEPLRQAQYADLATWLAGMMLVKVDRTSMANGLEVRAPFLDHRLVSWGLSLPTSLKLHGREGKHVLKRALEPYLPRETLYRPKQGFAPSLGGLLRREAARVRPRLLGQALGDCGLFDMTALARLLDEHEHGSRDHSAALWQLLVFEGFLVSEMGAQEATGRIHYVPVL